MVRNTTAIIIGIFLLATCQAAAQKRLVEQVKQDVNNMSLTVDNYKDAINKIEPALTNEETKDEGNHAQRRSGDAAPPQGLGHARKRAPRTVTHASSNHRARLSPARLPRLHHCHEPPRACPQRFHFMDSLPREYIIIADKG